MKSENQKQKLNKGFKNLSLTSLGWDLALPIFGGVLIGYQIDQNITNSGYRFTISLLIIGIIVGYYNIYKYIDYEFLKTKLAKKDDKDQSKT
jgi:predicted F0F1-ATPase subunit